jgi:hypothetical protein
MIKPDELLIKLKQQVQDNIISELPKIEGVEYQSNCHGMSYGCLNLLDIIIRIPNCSGKKDMRWDMTSMSIQAAKGDPEKRYTVLMKYRDYVLTTTCPPTRNFQTPQFYISGNEIKNLPEEITRLVTKWRAYEKGIQKLFTKEIYDKEKAIWDKLMIEVPKMGKKVKWYMPELGSVVQQAKYQRYAIQIDNSDICIHMPPVDWEAKSNLIGQPINKIDLRVIKMGIDQIKAVRPSNFTKKLKELLKQQ